MRKKTLIIGVIGLQGAVSEHLQMLKTLGAEGVWVRRKSQLKNLQGLIIPGGESTTISKLMQKSGMFNEIKRMGKKGSPIMGTCAGLILLAKKGDLQTKKTKTKLLGLMNMEINRNAFGRQKESFEKNIKLKIFQKPFHCIFIRAPIIKKAFGKTRVLGRIKEGIILAEKGNLLACAFHPELTSDLRIHEYFLKKVKAHWKK